MNKGLEALNRTIERLQNGEKIIVRDYIAIEKELKALEIIKNADDVDKKIILALFENGVIPQEEYDLLKEVLL